MENLIQQDLDKAKKDLKPLRQLKKQMDKLKVYASTPQGKANKFTELTDEAICSACKVAWNVMKHNNKMPKVTTLPNKPITLKWTSSDLKKTFDVEVTEDTISYITMDDEGNNSSGIGNVANIENDKTIEDIAKTIV